MEWDCSGASWWVGQGEQGHPGLGKFCCSALSQVPERAGHPWSHVWLRNPPLCVISPPAVPCRALWSLCEGPSFIPTSGGPWASHSKEKVALRLDFPRKEA